MILSTFLSAAFPPSLPPFAYLPTYSALYGISIGKETIIRVLLFEAVTHLPGSYDT